MLNFKYKLTKNYSYFESFRESLCKYRVQGPIKTLHKFLMENLDTKLIPLMKKLDALPQFKVESKISNLWFEGYHSSVSIPHGTVGGLDYSGSTFTGEFNDAGFPIMGGRNMNCQNAGALKGGKTTKEIEEAESTGKWSAWEKEFWRKEKEKQEIEKYDMRQRNKK